MKSINLYILIFALFVSPVFCQDKETPPTGGIPRDFNLPEYLSQQLNNGLKLVMIPWGNIPKVTISIVVRTGKIHEGENEVWLSRVVGDMLEEGSTSMTGNEIADKLATMGGELNISVNYHTTTISTSVLYEFAPEAIFILADVLMNPSFPESELSRLLDNRKRDLSVSLSRPRAQARQDFYRAIYPNHPYGKVFPTSEMLDSYSLNTIKSFYENYFGAKRTTVYVAGMFNGGDVISSVTDAFSSWKEGPEISYPEATPQTIRSISIVDRPDAPQSTIMMGIPVVDPSDPNWMPMVVTNSLLGGSFISRITTNIREDKGYTYSPFAAIDANYHSAIWYEQADVTTSVTGASLREIIFEINRLQNEAPSEEELSGIKNLMSGTFILSNSTPDGIIGQMNFLQLHGLDDSYLNNYIKSVHAINPQQVSDITKKYIKPEEMTIVIVGDKKKIEGQIEEYEKESKEY